MLSNHHALCWATMLLCAEQPSCWATIGLRDYQSNHCAEWPSLWATIVLSVHCAEQPSYWANLVFSNHCAEQPSWWVTIMLSDHGAEQPSCWATIVLNIHHSEWPLWWATHNITHTMLLERLWSFFSLLLCIQNPFVTYFALYLDKFSFNNLVQTLDRIKNEFLTV